MTSFLTRRSARTITVLAISQIVAWGTTFDMLGVMGRTIAPDLGLSNEFVFSGLTIMMVTSAVLGPSTGRWLGRYGAARVLAAGSLTFALGLLILAACHGVVLYAAAWVLIGIGGALGLSAPAYAAVVEREGLDGKRVIAILMLFTGLSATIFWPLLSLVEAAIGWRMTFLLSASIHLFVCLPLHLFGLPAPQATSTAGGSVDAAPVEMTAGARRAAFVLIAAATTISAFLTFGIVPSLLELLRQSGASEALALQLGAARGVIGISARGVDMALGKRSNPVLSAGIAAALMLVSFPLLLFAGPALLPLYGFILLYSFGSGVFAVSRALLPLSVFSAREYGLQAARLSLPQNLAMATAPVIFTALLDRGGSGSVIAVSIGLSAIVLVLVVALQSLIRRAHARANAVTPA
ncbi:MFS transporter [Rhizobiaceae bacterium n13]|uniref:MFS transporter n=1 Tax=Ferirhizobium litorale TaxID=2927786 RepID=A0AAE3QD89_9HYPH|nr:MFS transporter [Fererhizobium litorale]MDI7861263.1 MFS transporter [Fererhizobium litorale]MDI7921410.1 MFS transporter [Fererhizobium litorale]